MAKQEGEKISLSVDELKDLLGSKQEPETQPETLEDAFNRAMKLREKASGKLKPFQYCAFASPTRAIGVAFITESRTHRTGRTIKFEVYESPPYDQQKTLDKAPDKTLDDDRGSRENPKYSLWHTQQYWLSDLRSFLSGQDASMLPNAGPRRETLDEALLDLAKLRLQRDHDYAERAKLQDQAPAIELPAMPLPKPVKG